MIPSCTRPKMAAISDGPEALSNEGPLQPGEDPIICNMAFSEGVAVSRPCWCRYRSILRPAGPPPALPMF
jgi:hypothetical protein